MTRMRRGFSLVEMMVAMTITIAVFAITLPFVRAQTRSLGSTAGRLDADQVARFAMRAVEQDLRRAAGYYGQPTIVAAGPMVLSFNANLRRADADDDDALETEVVGPDTGAAWPVARAASIPTTNRTYPAADYVNADGEPSLAETVTYYLQADAAAGTDMYAMFRQFNDQPPAEIIDGLYLPSGQQFFSFYRIVNDSLAEIPETGVVYWDDARMAEIRAIGLRASARYENRYDGSEFVRTIETRVTLPVSLGDASCAAAPSAPSSQLSLTQQNAPRAVQLQWGKVAEDSGDPTRVQRYVVRRRPVGGAWSTIAVVEANGSGNVTQANRYQWTYASRDAGSFEYGVLSEGCGGLRSSLTSLGTADR